MRSVSDYQSIFMFEFNLDLHSFLIGLMLCLLSQQMAYNCTGHRHHIAGGPQPGHTAADRPRPGL